MNDYLLRRSAAAAHVGPPSVHVAAIIATCVANLNFDGSVGRTAAALSISSRSVAVRALFGAILGRGVGGTRLDTRHTVADVAAVPSP